MRMRLILPLSIAVASGVSAQDAPPSPPPQEPPIIVTAPRAAEDELRAFADALSVPAGEQQLARFETRAVCPVVLGAVPAQAQVIADRMRKVARAADVPLATDECAANVLLIIVADKAAFLRMLAKKHGYLFGNLRSREVRALQSDPGPIAAWHVAGPDLNADGVEIPVDIDGVQRNFTTRSPSRITFAARPHVAGALVIVESKALAGLTLTQLGDYAAMRAYTSIDPARLRDTAVPTILKAIETPMGSELPLSLTRWDLGVLRGLYSAPVNLRAAAQRSAIRGSMRKEIGGR